MAGVTMLFLLALASGLAAGRLLRGSSDQNGSMSSSIMVLRPDPRSVRGPLGMRFAANWPPNHLGDFRTFFDELLHGFCLDLIARSWEFDVDLSEDSAR
jgi:hypothetical protein